MESFQKRSTSLCPCDPGTDHGPVGYGIFPLLPHFSALLPHSAPAGASSHITTIQHGDEDWATWQPPRQAQGRQGSSETRL